MDGDFTDADCREVLERLIETVPVQAACAVAEHWEAKREAARMRHMNRIGRALGAS